jgi:hypothetical protein
MNSALGFVTRKPSPQTEQGGFGMASRPPLPIGAIVAVSSLSSPLFFPPSSSSPSIVVGEDETVGASWSQVNGNNNHGSFSINNKSFSILKE